MRDSLPATPNTIECGVVNLGAVNTQGSHWVCYYMNETGKKYYFDSYGDAKPPLELISYLGGNRLYYNENRIQEYDDPPICGHLCLVILYFLSNKNEPLENVLRRFETDKYFWVGMF